jgi:DNA-binding CsgD family transcriptional regulator
MQEYTTADTHRVWNAIRATPAVRVEPSRRSQLDSGCDTVGPYEHRDDRDFDEHHYPDRTDDDGDEHVAGCRVAAVGDVLNREEVQRRWEEHRQAERERPPRARGRAIRPACDSTASGACVFGRLIRVSGPAVPGREAEATLRSVREALGELIDSGAASALADQVERELEQATGRASSGAMVESPSEAELAVLRLLAGDLSTREIGERLFLSANTIRSHTRALYRKLGVHSRTDAIARAAALGLLEQTQSPR